MARLRAANAALSTSQAVEKAREDALKLLDTQARSSGVVRTKLAQRGYASAAIDQVIERLTRVGLLNDTEYAAMLVRTRFAERGLVGRALQQELAKYGIAPQCAQQALSQLDAEDVAERARQLALKKVGADAGADVDRLKRRTLSYLARRGYCGAVALDALNYALQQAEPQ